MGNHDDITLRFYSRNAEAYTARNRKPDARLEKFMRLLPPEGKVLELGCGSGHDSERMIAHGFDVTPTDGTPEIAEAAERRLGRPVPVLLFEDIASGETYDGIWASACLLHVHRDRLSVVLGKIRSALKPGGLFFASYKSGDAEGRDRFDRYFNYPTEGWLRTAYGDAWQSIHMERSIDNGYDKESARWLNVFAVKRKYPHPASCSHHQTI